MRVYQLIETLQRLDPMMRVMVADEDRGVRREVSSVEGVGANPKYTNPPFSIRPMSCSANMIAIVAELEPEGLDVE